jgi:hypothetical protein
LVIGSYSNWCTFKRCFGSWQTMSKGHHGGFGWSSASLKRSIVNMVARTSLYAQHKTCDLVLTSGTWQQHIMSYYCQRDCPCANILNDLLESTSKIKFLPYSSHARSGDVSASAHFLLLQENCMLIFIGYRHLLN